MKKLFALLLVLLLANCTSSVTKTENVVVHHVAPVSKSEKELLFVQKGETASYRGGVLMLNRTAPHTVYFIDRTFKTSGHISNAEFFKRWNEAKEDENYKNNNPSATISYYRKNRTPEIAVLELSHPKIGKHNAITYNVKILSGTLPEIISEPTLFIDSIVWDMGEKTI